MLSMMIIALFLRMRSVTYIYMNSCHTTSLLTGIARIFKKKGFQVLFKC